jgi:hypothetical protein
MRAGSLPTRRAQPPNHIPKNQRPTVKATGIATAAAYRGLLRAHAAIVAEFAARRWRGTVIQE